MRAILSLAGLLAALGIGTSLYLRAHPEAMPLAQLPQQVRGMLQGIQQRASAALGQVAPSPQPASSDQSPRRAPGPVDARAFGHAPAPPPERLVTLYLTNGGVVSGELIRETPAEVTLHWDYGDVGFRRTDIHRMVQGRQDTGDDGMTMPWEGEHRKIRWPYRHDIVVKLMNGAVLDAQVTGVTPEALTLTQTVAGGGAAEQAIPRKDVEELLFKPIRNARADEIERSLQTALPEMQWRDEGFFTIVTDSAPPAVKDYARTIRELATDWYLTFFPLVKDKAPMVPHYVVIFESWDDYIAYAATDGVPGWLAVGYYNPDDEVFYCFNMLGERFAQLLSDAYLGQFREARDRVSSQIKGSRYEVFIEGQLSEFLQKLETAHGMVRQTFQELNTAVIRHELTHAMFHNWRLQGITLSKMSPADREKAAKKRAYLTEQDEQQKRKLLDDLLKNEAATDLSEIQAANAWFIEGLAGYMEPTPVGALNLERLSEIQEARRRQQVLPLEFLDVFKMGSFLKMANQSALYAYAQSWAFCHFLMHRYPDGFAAYLERVAREQPEEGEETLAWLMEALHTEQRPLEQEFLAYVDRFPPEDSSWMKQMKAFLDLRAELIALAHRLWG